MESSTDHEFLTRFRGSFAGILRWNQFDELWEKLRTGDIVGWYVYAVGESPPEKPASKEQFVRFLEEMSSLLRQDHDEDYCGIVYVDDTKKPAFIKIFDPNNLGVVCGASDNPPLPGWIVSRIAPVDLPNAFPPNASRKRWWQRLFSGN